MMMRQMRNGFHMENLPELAFDHAEIVKYAMEKFHSKKS